MKRKEINSSRMPVYRDSGFELYDARSTSEAFNNEINHEREPAQYIYSRYRNPTVVSAEEEIMKIENCKWALLTQSGMSAIDTALSIFQHGKKTKPWLFFSEIYGGTISFLEYILKMRRGLDINYFTPDNEKYDLAKFEELLSKMKPEIVYIESISNPMLIVADIAEITRISKKHGSKIIVDNTFATPFLYKPLVHSADIVIHSATKYFSGHGNITAGVLCGNDKEIMKSAIEYRKFVGHMLSPDDAYRLQTQLLSFELRFRCQCDNALRLAEYLNSSRTVQKVWFPGLKSHTTYSTASKLFGDKGFGAMITFDFRGSDNTEKREKRDKFIKLVSDRIKLIPTLGDPHTILMPIESVWGTKYPEPGMIRLSVGFEAYSDLESTVGKALETL
jgi:cystathionine beta-lyase/cystathionine gamma-synthase